MVAAPPSDSLGFLALIPAAPFAAFLLIGIVTLRRRLLSAAIAITAIGVSFVCAVGAFLHQLNAAPGAPHVETITWLKTGTLDLSVGLLLDPLSAVMLVVVTTVAVMVQVYSLGYMAGEKSLGRFYAYLSLFCAAMLGLVLSTNFLQLFIFW